MPRNVQITVQLHSFHMRARLCSNSFKLGFSCTWTENFKMYKLETQRKQRSNCQHTLDDRKSKGIKKKKKTWTSASLTTLKPLSVWITTNCNILNELGIPDHLTCLLRNLYAGQETTVRIGHGTRGWFKIGKGVCQGYILPPCLFNLYAEYIMQIARLDESTTWDMQMIPL